MAWTAWACGFAGSISAWWLGTQVLALTDWNSLLCVLASNGAGMAALLLTLQSERRPWIRRHVLTRSWRTWTFFLSIYFGGMLLIAPPLREPRILAWLAIPLMASTGFTILIFGPIQDRLTKRS